MEHLRQHSVTLHAERLILRPMGEGDWPLLLAWSNDAEILYYSEGDDLTHYDLADVQRVYRAISRQAFCFIIERDGAAIGECWLQRMNLARLLQQYPGLDCRRIDLVIGEKSLWNQGIGTQVIRLLTAFGFEEERADAIFACDVADYNPRSRRAFQRAGFDVCGWTAQPPGRKASICYDLVLQRGTYQLLSARVRPMTKGDTHAG
jgi:aminoglycoside 6'-N-acetyltransferase